MTPVDFKYSNRVLQPPNATYSENIDGVDPLHVWTDGEQCVSCWQMSWKERLSALIFGRVWLSVLFGQTQPPVYVQASKEYFMEVASNGRARR